MANYDVEILKVTDVTAHPNADRLELVELGGWISIAPKGKIQIGEDVIYIHPDAKLDLTKEWTKNYATFVSPKKCRVKTIKLRGCFSEGMIVKPEDILQYGFTMDQFVLGTDPEKLAEILGITHYELPMLESQFEMRTDYLPYNLPKTDQTNIQALTEADYKDRKFLVTRKKDGSSCTITCEIDSIYSDYDFHVCSRRFDIKLDQTENAYIQAATPVMEAVRKYYEVSWKTRLKENQVLVLRGEVCGSRLQAKSFNIDSVGDPTFFLFEAYILNKKTHEIELRYNPRNLAFVLGINSVPTMGFVENIDDAFIEKYLLAPASDGEGIVLWEVDKVLGLLTGHSFKIRSKEYDSHLG